MAEDNRLEKLFFIGIVAAIIMGLYFSSLYSYLLFHGLVEIITISIAFTLFILTWNTRSYLTNNYLRLLGIGYAFIAFIDLLHTLAYKGMNVFPDFGANLPTQLWVAARYLQAVTLLVAPLLVERRMDNRAVFGGYTAAAATLVVLIYSGNFPDCFIEGKGLTLFKISSEYIISALLLAALYLLFRNRTYFKDRVFFLVALSIVFTALSEISFTAYVSVYGFANLVGHYSKLAAFYLMYRAVLVTGLREPFDLIFRDLKLAEEALRKSRENLEEQVSERTTELEAVNRELKEEVTERKRAEEEVRMNLFQQKALLDVYQKMPTARVTEVIAFVTDKCVNLTGSVIGFVGLISDDGRHMEAHIWSETAMENCPLDKPLNFPIDEAGLWAEPIRQRKTIIVNDYHEPSPFKKGCPDGHLELLRFMGIPVLDNDRVVAVAGVANKRENYSETDQYKVFMLLKGMWDIIKRKRAEEELRGLNDELEQRVRERTAELERRNHELVQMNKAFVGRELRMVELKARIRELEKGISGLQTQE